MEDNKGFGPYSSKNEEATDIFKFHKAPENQGVKIPSEKYYFAWNSLLTLKNHLTDEKKYLHNSKIWKVSVYKIEKPLKCIYCPDGQVAFIKKHAILIERINFRNLNMIRKYT